MPSGYACKLSVLICKLFCICLIFNLLEFVKKVSAMKRSPDNVIDAPYAFLILASQFSFIKPIILYLSLIGIFHVSKLWCGILWLCDYFQKNKYRNFLYVNIFVVIKQFVIHTISLVVLFSLIEFFLCILYITSGMPLCTSLSKKLLK